MKIKSKLKDILLLLFSTIFLIIILELFLMIFWKKNESNVLNNTLTPIIEFDPVLGTKYKKNSIHRVISQYNEFEVNYEINEYGLRSSELNLDTANNFKILGIGNSFLEGWGVNEDSTFISLYNKSVKRKIINAGISGYGVIQSSLITKKYLEKFNPQKVILFFVPSMTLGDAKYLKNAKLNDNGIVVGVNLGNYLLKKTKKEKTFLSNSNLYNLISERLGNYKKIKKSTNGDYDSDLFAFFKEKKKNPYKEIVDKHIIYLNKYLSEKNIKFEIIYINLPMQISSNEWDLGRKINKIKKNPNLIHEENFKNFCKINNIICHFSSTFLKNKIIDNINDQRLYYRYDFHFNEYGNIIFSQWLKKLFNED